MPDLSRATIETAALERVLDDFVHKAQERVCHVHTTIMRAAEGSRHGRMHLAAEEEVRPIHDQTLNQMIEVICKVSQKTGVPLQELYEVTKPKLAALTSAMMQPIRKVAEFALSDASQRNILTSHMTAAEARLKHREDSALQLRALLETTGESQKNSSGQEFIAQSRLVELRGLVSGDFDFRKLIRLCEELNINNREECYLATAMLTRALLDHLPPLFGKENFSEVANNYSKGSFKKTMQHLQNSSRSVADGHLHQQIRRSDTLPTAQQVNCAQQIDVLLAEVIRITQEKGPKV